MSILVKQGGGGGGYYPSLFAYGDDLTSSGSATLSKTGKSYNGTWSSKTISGVVTNGWSFPRIELGTYTLTVTESGQTSTQTVAVDVITDYEVEVQMSRLPSGYKELSYIESTGTQYIDTGLTGTNNFEFRTSYMLKSIDAEYHYLFGSSDSQMYLLRTSQSNSKVGFIGASGTSVNFGNITTNVWNDLEITHDGTTATVDFNGTESTGSIGSTTLTRNIYLFARDHQGSPYVTTSEHMLIGCMKETYIKLGSQEWHGIPCIRMSDGEVGMYDTVTEAFFGNSGTGTFLIGAVVDGSITSTYQQVEYLQGGGTRYIDTNVKNANIDKITCVHKAPSSLSDIAVPIGASYNPGTNNKYIVITTMNSSSGPSALVSSWLNSNQSQTTLAVTVLNCPLNGTATATINSVSGSLGTVYNIDYSFYLFKMHWSTTTTAGWNATVNIYQIALSQNSVCSHFFIPMYRISDSVAGMYDLVTGTFLTNSGTGTFAVGGDVDVE